MAIEFREVSFASLLGFTAVAPAGAAIGLIGDRDSGARALLRLAGGLDQPTRGEVRVDGTARYLGPSDALNLAPADALLLDHALAQHDAVVRARAAIGLERLRRAGATVLLASHEEDLLRGLCDEVWWLHQGRLAVKADPRETLRQYRHHVAECLRAWGETAAAPLNPAMRRGDGRARILAVETLGESGRPTMVWRSGEPAAVTVAVRFEQPVDDPVIGIMIRTRIGFEVYGTNTELEGLKLGPCGAGDNLKVAFSFRCDLCPEQYTVTAASHDPDGVWHDWLEDAVAVSVADERYTAGVANLRARVTVEKLAAVPRL